MGLVAPRAGSDRDASIHGESIGIGFLSSVGRLGTTGWSGFYALGVTRWGMRSPFCSSCCSCNFVYKIASGMVVFLLAVLPPRVSPRSGWGGVLGSVMGL